MITVLCPFLGGSSRGRTPWRGGTETYRERGHPDDEWQTARGSRRSYHDHEDVRWGSSSERLPEWSNDDNDDFTTPGTFDSSGAFVSKVILFLTPDQSYRILGTYASFHAFCYNCFVFFSKRKKERELKRRQKVMKKVKIQRKIGNLK